MMAIYTKPTFLLIDYMRLQVIAKFMSLLHYIQLPPNQTNLSAVSTEDWTNKIQVDLLCLEFTEENLDSMQGFLLVLVYHRLSILVSIVSDPR